jgi:hypothetical protein
MIPFIKSGVGKEICPPLQHLKVLIVMLQLVVIAKKRWEF